MSVLVSAAVRHSRYSLHPRHNGQTDSANHSHEAVEDAEGGSHVEDPGAARARGAHDGPDV